MARSSRTFTLNLSPSGVELFLDCHHRLCQHRADLLPYGQTLYSALLHLAHVEALAILDDLRTLKRSGLLGPTAFFVGAPSCLNTVAERISAMISRDVPGHGRSIIIGQLYVVALKRFRRATPDEIIDAYAAMIEEAGSLIRMPRRRSVREAAR